MKNLSLATIMLAASMSSFAQSNQIDLFGTVGKIIGGVSNFVQNAAKKNQNNTINNEAPGKEDILKIVETYSLRGSSAILLNKTTRPEFWGERAFSEKFNCSNEEYIVALSVIQKTFSKYGKNEAGRIASNFAAHSASCSEAENHDRLAERAKIMGNMLYISRSYLTNEKTPNFNQSQKEDIVKLLSYASSAGDVDAKNILAEFNQKESSDREEVKYGVNKLAASEVSQLASDNRFSFDKKYADKYLQVTGLVKNISPSGNGVTITLDGATKKNDGKISTYCKISEENSSQALSIKNGISITVKGFYKRERYDMGDVTLNECTIM